MTAGRLRSAAAIILGLLPAATGASAAPEKLACVLAAGQPGQESITISFDAAARSASVSTAAGAYAFRDLAVSSVAISGIATAVSFGIDRSTLRVVWQRYDERGGAIRYGECRATAATAAGQGG